MNPTLAALGAWSWALLAPLAMLLLAPLLDGIARQIRARLESRAGPPILQGYLDLAKLASKRETSAATGWLARWMPVLALAATAAAGAVLPIGGHAPLGFAGDAVVALYLLGLASVALVLAGSAGGSAFGFLGANREMLLLGFAEPVVAAALFVAALKAGSFRLDVIVAWQAQHGPGVSGVLAALGALIALPAAMGRLPFDLAEADQELMGGAMIEFGGPRLALLRWTWFVRWLVLALLVSEVFAPTLLPFAIALPVALIKTLALFAIVAAGGVLLARQRIDQARAIFAPVGLMMLFAIAFALTGA